MAQFHLARSGLNLVSVAVPLRRRTENGKEAPTGGIPAQLD
jgi:hypothetical protein